MLVFLEFIGSLSLVALHCLLVMINKFIHLAGLNSLLVLQLTLQCHHLFVVALNEIRLLQLAIRKQFAIFHMLLKDYVHLFDDGMGRRMALFVRREARKRTLIVNVFKLLRVEHVLSLLQMNILLAIST